MTFSDLDQIWIITRVDWLKSDRSNDIVWENTTTFLLGLGLEINNNKFTLCSLISFDCHIVRNDGCQGNHKRRLGNGRPNALSSFFFSCLSSKMSSHWQTRSLPISDCVLLKSNAKTHYQNPWRCSGLTHTGSIPRALDVRRCQQFSKGKDLTELKTINIFV